MLREPYNVNPYNSTIDTSKANNYGFTFSGDELGSFKIQIAKNNSSPEIVYTSKKFVPDDVGYENIYDGDMVEGIILPSAEGDLSLTNRDGDGFFLRVYEVAGVTIPSNIVKLKIDNKYEITNIETSESPQIVATDLSLGRTFSSKDIKGYDLADNETVIASEEGTDTGTFTFIGYYLTIKNAEDPPDDWTLYKVQIEDYSFPISGSQGITGSDYVRLRLTSDTYISAPKKVEYLLYKPNTNYEGTKGQDLLWRAQLFEPGNPSAVQNFLRQGAFYGTTTLGSSSTPLYEGDINLTILDNFSDKRSSIVRKVQIGDDMFLETINSATQMTVTIMPQLNYSSLETDMQNFTTLLNTNYTTTIIDIDKNTFSLANGSAAVLSSDKSYITLTLNGDTSKLQPKLYYNYFIEFRNDEITTNIINGIVTKTTVLKADEDPFIYTFKTQNLSESPIGFTFYEYSNGDQRIFYNFNKTLTGLTSFPVPYRLYSNGINSNWYFFQSRETPVLTLQAKPSNSTDWQSFPLTVTTRKIKYKGTYSQADGIGVRYHKWRIVDSEENVIFQTSEIYNSDFTLNREILDANGVYTVTLTIVNQAGVETSISGDITADINISKIEAACNAEVNDNEHTVEITWLNGLGSEPEEEAGDNFGNRISVGKTGQDYQLNEGKLTYSTISGGPIEIKGDELTTRLGLVINDDAKVKIPNEDFYNSTFFTLRSPTNPINFNKRGLDVVINNSTSWFRLLENTDGQVALNVHSWANHYLGKNYIWDENNSNEWRNEDYWTETKSDTNCYFYEIEIQGNKTIAYRIPFQRVSLSQGNNLTSASFINPGIEVPYNPLFGTASSVEVKVRIDDGVEGTETISYSATLKPNDDKKTSTLVIGENQNFVLSSIPQEIVIYKPFDSEPTAIGASTSIGTSGNDYTGFILGPKTNLFYFTVWDGSPAASPSFPYELGEKPSWQGQDDMRINVKFNGSLLSSRLEEMGSAVSGYQVYRRKWDLIGSEGLEPIYSDKPIYTRLVGTFDLADEGLTTSPKFKFIDWSVENRGIFDYVIVPIPEDTSDSSKTQENNIYSNQKVTTDWYGWSFTSFDKFPTGHFEPLERWLFKLNIQTNGYTHQTNKVFHQGFNRYPKVSIGTTNYITTNLSCLIGEINKELKRSYWHKEKQGYTRDNIITIEKWEDFSNRSDLVLIKDYKGRVFIGTIDGNIMSFEDVIAEILTTLSFNVTQIDSDTNYQIFSIEGE